MKILCDSPIVLPAITSEELTIGLKFVSDQYLRVFGVLPSPPDHLLIAWDGGKIVGTIGINVCSPHSNLRLQNLYKFDNNQKVFPFDPSLSVEFTRWASETNGVASQLLYAATCFSINLGKKFVWCEHGRIVNRVCRKYGINFYDTSSVQRDDSKIEPYYLAFYQKADPRFFMFNLDLSKSGLEQYLNKR
ncbi:MAG: hypothetical protein ABIT47_01755 [Candidatus Paceibacterota bacterium]